MRDPDPENLRKNYSPAMLTPTDGRKVFAAHVSLKDNGWVRLVAWDGTTEYVPPQRVHKIRRVETEIDRDDGETYDQAAKRVADPEQRERARELQQEAEAREVVA